MNASLRLVRPVSRFRMGALAVVLAAGLGPAHAWGQLPSLTHPLSADQLTRSTADALAQANWTAHLDRVEGAVQAAFQNTPPVLAAQRYEAVLNDPVLAHALAQAAFIRQVTPAVVESLARSPADREFLGWLLGQRIALEEYLDAIKPEDDPATVLRAWSGLWRGDPTGRDKYFRLALACALVFDQPVQLVPELRYSGADPLAIGDRYTDFRTAADHGELKTPLAALPARELVWVVDAPVPATELAWARRHVSLSRSQWANAYTMVPYLMERATAGPQPYTNYTLAEIRKKGGVCTDRAHFAAISAKANGIPAMPIHGEGQRGAHAWFGYKASAREWNMEAGRFEDDRYATGFTRDPQTGATIKEQMLQLMADSQRDTPAYLVASRLQWLARVFTARGDTGRANEALRVAVTRCPRHLPAWLARFDLFKTTTAPPAQWQEALAAGRSAFRKYPDVLQTVTRLETEQLTSSGNSTQAAETLRQQYRKLKGRPEDRTDLLAENVETRGALFEKAGDLAAAEKVYRDALAEQGQSVPAFETLARAYLAFADRHQRTADATGDIYSVYRRYHGSAKDTGDYFALQAYVNLTNFVADILEQNGDEQKAARLRKTADQFARRAKTRNW